MENRYPLHTKYEFSKKINGNKMCEQNNAEKRKLKLIINIKTADFFKHVLINIKIVIH